jgi:hypothetical protein
MFSGILGVKPVKKETEPITKINSRNRNSGIT